MSDQSQSSKRRRRMEAINHQHILCVLILTVIFSSHVTGHYHTEAEHKQQRIHEWRLHQQRQSGEAHVPRNTINNSHSHGNKSSKMWVINSFPEPKHQQGSSSSNGWAWRGWHNHLMTNRPSQTTTTSTTTTTTTTTTPRPTPFPSLWNYAPKRTGVAAHHHGNRTGIRELNPKTG